jgi:hypothetical protein
VAAALLWSLAGIALFTCYLHVSRTAAVNSDGASNALQAWDMLHGNLLLHGWQLSDVSFYTTELPEYMLIEWLRGLRPDVVHIAAAMTYTLLVLLSAMLAKGKSTGGQAAARIAITAGIMLAPQLGSGVFVLMLSPDHVGTTVPVLLTWILLDRARQRWYVPAAAAVLLTWALVADNIVLIIGVLPLAVACAARAYQASVRRRLLQRSSWFDLSLVAMALLTVFGARTVVSLISSRGGYTIWPVTNQLSSFSQLPQHLLLTIQGLLLLFGANFFGHSLGYVSVLAIAHLVGLGLAAWALCAAFRRFPDQDRVVQILAIGTAISLAAYLFGQRALDLNTTREFTAVLPYGAVLAGRLLAGPVAKTRLLPALAVVLTAYVLSLGRVVAQPPVPAQNQQLASWLTAHRLDYGLAGYWAASSTTLDSGGHILLCPVLGADGRVTRDDWETQRSCYNPADHDANFVVLAPDQPDGKPYPSSADAIATLGQPARIYYTGSYTVLVWNKNLLTALGSAAVRQAGGPVPYLTPAVSESG